MISANELRLGNIINCLAKDGFWYKSVVSGLTNNEITVGVGIIPSDINPIPLTEQILLKCGFEKLPHFTVMNSLIFKLGRNRELSLGCVGTPNEMLFLNEVDNEDNPTKVNDLVCIHNFDYDGKLYLHKIQNIVAIFGKELYCTQIL